MLPAPRPESRGRRLSRHREPIGTSESGCEPPACGLTRPRRRHQVFIIGATSVQEGKGKKQRKRNSKRRARGEMTGEKCEGKNASKTNRKSRKSKTAKEKKSAQCHKKEGIKQENKANQTQPTKVPQTCQPVLIQVCRPSNTTERTRPSTITRTSRKKLAFKVRFPACALRTHARPKKG